MKKLLLVLILFIAFNTKSQTLNWAKQIGGPTSINSNQIASDAAGNVYVAGTFQFTADFDPSGATQNLSSFANSIDTFLAKYDSDGNFIWVKQMGGTSNEGIVNLLVDPSGNAYLHGAFLGMGTFGSTVLDVTQGEVFLTKIDASGNFVWTGQLKCHFPRTINLIGNDILISGHNYAITTDFDLGTGVSNQTFAGYIGQYLARYTPSGGLVWAKTFTGPADSYVQVNNNGIYVDPSENIYVANKFGPSFDVDPDAGTTILTATGPDFETAFFKLNSSGALIWAKKFGGSTTGFSGTVTADPTGNLQVTSTFTGTADMDPGAGVTNLTAVNYKAIFLSKFDPAGNFISTRKLDGPASPAENIYQWNSYFKANGKNVIELIVSGNYDLGDGVQYYPSVNVIACYDASNNLLWKEVMPYFSSGTFSQAGSSILTVASLNNNGSNFDVNPASGPANVLNMNNTAGGLFFRKSSVDTPPVIGPGLVANYPFNGNADDATGNTANNGTALNGAILTADRFGNSNAAYYFDGVDDYIEAAADNLPTGNSTVSLWFKADVGSMLTNPGMFGYGGNGGACPGNSFIMQLYASGGNNSFVSHAHCGTNQLFYNHPEIPEEKWYNWVVTTNGTTIKMYLNGKLVSTSNANINSKIVAGKKLNMGAVVSLLGFSNYTDANVGRFKGVLDDVKIYNGELPASEIFDNYIKDLTKPGSGIGLQLTRTGMRSTDPWVNIGEGYSFGSEPFTYETWLKRDDLHTTLNDNGLGLFLGENNGTWGVGIANNNTVFFTKIGINGSFSTGTIADTKWHHVAVAYTGTELKFYIDGVAAGTNNYTDSFTSNGNYTIGARQSFGNANGDQTINGAIDETRIWRNVALSESEIRDWMCKKVTSTHPKYDKLFGYFNFDETTSPVRGFGGNFGAFVNSPQLQTSGAAVGDESSYTYGGSAVSLGVLGTEATIDNFLGNPTGMQLYRVNEKPNVTTLPLGSQAFKSNQYYYGVFPIGGTNASYKFTQKVVGLYPNTSFVADSMSQLLSRPNNSGTWENAFGKTNNTLENISVRGNSTEYAIANNINLSKNKAGSGKVLSLSDLQYIEANDNPDFTFGNTFSASAWIKTTSLNADIFSNFEPTFPFTGTLFGVGFGSLGNNSDPRAGKLGFYIGNSTGNISESYNDLSGPRVDDNKWHHVVITYNGTQVKFYVDGILGSTLTANNNLIGNSANKLRIGRDNNEPGIRYFNGNIDELQLWRTAISETEIRDWMCKKVTATHPQFSNLVAYFNFDEGQGAITGGFGGNFGSLLNTPTWQTSGAAIGDDSDHDFVNTIKSALISHTTGESFLVESISGNPAGLQVYRVDAAPSNLTGHNGLDPFPTYYGVFQTGGTNPTYTGTYTYFGNNVGGAEANLRLYSRANNSSTSWTENSTLPDMPNDKIVITGQSTEYILGTTFSPLPLDLLSFSGKTENNQNILNWQTANEVAFSHFEVERGPEASVALAPGGGTGKFEKIGEVKANGGPSEKIGYEFADQILNSSLSTPPSGRYGGPVRGLFYRLKMVDLDGKFKYSKIIFIQDETPPPGAGGRIYPNPTSEYFSLSGNEFFEKLQIVDTAGRILKEFLHNADNKYSLIGISSGVYFLKKISDNHLIMNKLIVK